MKVVFSFTGMPTEVRKQFGMDTEASSYLPQTAFELDLDTIPAVGDTVCVTINGIDVDGVVRAREFFIVEGAQTQVTLTLLYR